MNLATDGWIPILDRHGAPARVSLENAFVQGENIADLSARPDERVALMRLLIAVAQAALDGPRDAEDWRGSLARLPEAVHEYLKKWRHAFELFGNGERFLQLSGLETEDEEARTLVSKLDFALSTGHNDTLFDNAGGNPRTLPSERLALVLLTYQCFSPGGRIAVARWRGQPTPGNGSSSHAPCLPGSMIHAYIRGQNLLDTVHRNLLNKELVKRIYGGDRWGRPVWEWMPENFVDSKAVENATETYLGRLVPLSRSIWIEADLVRMILANGLNYPAFGSEGGMREAAATVTVATSKGNQEHRVLGLNIEKAIWRELHSLVVKRHSDQGVGGPLALENMDDNTALDLWTGGLATDQAKPLDLIESVFHIPPGMLCDIGTMTYERGVRLADGVAAALDRALSRYAVGLSEDREKGPRVQLPSLRSKARSLFWTAVERAVPSLLEAAGQAQRVAESGWWETAWGKELRRAVREALQVSCPRFTLRQLRAYVGAEAVLRQGIYAVMAVKGSGNHE